MPPVSAAHQRRARLRDVRVTSDTNDEAGSCDVTCYVRHEHRLFLVAKYIVGIKLVAT